MFKKLCLRLGMWLIGLDSSRSLLNEYLRELAEEDIKTEAYRNIIEEVRPEVIFNASRVNLGYIFEHFLVTRIELYITYNNDVYGGLSTHHFTDISSLDEFLNNFKPREKSFIGFQLHAYYDIPNAGEHKKTHVFVNSLDEKIINISEIELVFNEIKKCYANLPEMMI